MGFILVKELVGSVVLSHALNPYPLPQNIVGLILVKELVLVDEDAGVRVRDLRLREVPFLRADIPM